MRVLNNSCVFVVCNLLFNPSSPGRVQVYVVGKLGWEGEGTDSKEVRRAAVEEKTFE